MQQVVSAGSVEGPEGVSVELYRDETLVQARKTEEGGAYVFTPLSSGHYTVVASHPSWTFLSSKVGYFHHFISVAYIFYLCISNLFMSEESCTGYVLY